MITVEKMKTGKEYTCTFTLKNIPLDTFGRPGGMMSLADIPVDIPLFASIDTLNAVWFLDSFFGDI